MVDRKEAETVLAASDLVYTEAEVEAAISACARAIGEVLAARDPIVICVMNGGLPYTAALLARMAFPLQLDHVYATRFAGTDGGKLEWRTFPRRSFEGRDVLVVDDVLDRGITLRAVRERLLEAGASRVLTTVLADKGLPDRGIVADFAALDCPDRYLFGWGMDYHGYFRNLREIRALRG